VGSACMASRASWKAASSRNPWSTSCTTGRQVTTSSIATEDSSRNLVPLRNTSIQTEVSTRTTGFPARPAPHTIPAHVRQVSFPEAGTGQLEDSAGLRPAHVLLECPVDSSGVGSFAAQAQCLLQQLLIEHKIC